MSNQAQQTSFLKEENKPLGNKHLDDSHLSLKAPLAARMRPLSIDDIVGQDDVIGPNSSLGKIIRSESANVPSMILAGDPGTGKTTIASVIAKEKNCRFIKLSGVLDGAKELRKEVEDAKNALRRDGLRTIASVDEIHRFNKAQQDLFLPHLESGLLTIIGQTTENVSFRLRNAMLSRLRVIQLKRLNEEDISILIGRALSDKERGFGKENIKIEQEASKFIAVQAAGDARRALTSVEWAASSLIDEGSQVKTITKDLAIESFGSQPVKFDADADYHYDNISAFIKSMRGSDPDAALYYMVAALEGGEDPVFLTRRMIIFASEDCSSDPRALEMAVNADLALERVGLPEGRINLAQAVVYLSCASKSNASYKALRKIESVVRENPALEVPLKLRNAPSDLMKKQGNSLGYNYPHNFPEGYAPGETYLPEKLKGKKFYEPTNRGLDKLIKERLEYYRGLDEIESSQEKK